MRSRRASARSLPLPAVPLACSTSAASTSPAAQSRCPHQCSIGCPRGWACCVRAPRRVRLTAEPRNTACPEARLGIPPDAPASRGGPDKLRVNATRWPSGRRRRSPGDDPQDHRARPPPEMVKGPYAPKTYRVERDGAYLVVEFPYRRTPARVPATGPITESPPFRAIRPQVRKTAGTRAHAQPIRRGRPFRALHGIPVQQTAAAAAKERAQSRMRSWIGRRALSTIIGRRHPRGCCMEELRT